MRTRLRSLLVVLAVVLPLAFEAGDWTKLGCAADGKTSPDRWKAIQHVAPTVTGATAVRDEPFRSEPAQSSSVELGTAGLWTLGRGVRLPGRVAVDEARVHRLHAVTQGCTREIGPAAPGSVVNKGEILAAYYAPGIATLLLDFIDTVETCQKLQERPGRDHGARVREQLAAYERSLATTRHALLDLGVPVEQVDRVKTTLEFAWLVEIRSPVSGMVLARNVSNGERFGPSAELYAIADLSRVWILADVFESEAQRLKPGTRASVTHPGLGEALLARVSCVLPPSRPTMRTSTVRLEADNPGLVLRPDMIVDVELPEGPGGTDAPGLRPVREPHDRAQLVASQSS